MHGQGAVHGGVRGVSQIALTSFDID
jgi:hypothetical protein